MAAWFKRFGLHLAAAVGATGIFVAAAAVGATQTRQQVALVSGPTATLQTRTPAAQRKPSVVVATPAPTGQTATDPGAPATPPPTVAPQAPDSPQATPGPTQRSLAPPSQGQPAVATPRPVNAQPGAVEAQPDVDQPPPAAQQLPPSAPKPGVANSASPRPTPRTTPTARTSPSPTPAAQKVVPERSLAGTIKAVRPDGLDVLGVGGREWQVTPAPGALIRLNGKTVRLDSLQAGDTVVILGQAQSGAAGTRFLAHAITARRK